MEPIKHNIGELMEVLAKKKDQRKQFTYKVSYGSKKKEDDYRFSIAEVMRNSQPNTR